MVYAHGTYRVPLIHDLFPKVSKHPDILLAKGASNAAVLGCSLLPLTVVWQLVYFILQHLKLVLGHMKLQMRCRASVAHIQSHAELGQGISISEVYPVPNRKALDLLRERAFGSRNEKQTVRPGRQTVRQSDPPGRQSDNQTRQADSQTVRPARQTVRQSDCLLRGPTV